MWSLKNTSKHLKYERYPTIVCTFPHHGAGSLDSLWLPTAIIDIGSIWPILEIIFCCAGSFSNFDLFEVLQQSHSYFGSSSANHLWSCHGSCLDISFFTWNSKFNAYGFQHETYPLELTDPDHLSTLDKKDPHPLPPTASSSKLLEAAITQIKSIANSTVFNGSCAKCLAGLEVAKFLALAAPEQGSTFAVQVCELFDFANPCNATYGEDVLGSVVRCFSSAGLMMCSTSRIGNTDLRE